MLEIPFIILLILHFSTTYEKPYKILFHTSLSDKNLSYYSNAKDLSTQEIFDYLYKHNIITKICMGTVKSCFNIPITISSPHSWVCEGEKNTTDKHQYLSTKSSKYKNLTEPKEYLLSDKNRTAIHSRDIFKVSNNTSYNDYFEFFLVEQCKDDEFGQLGIGIDNKFTNDNITYLSVIDYIRNKNVISSSIITIIYKNNTFGKILIGTDYDNNKNMFIEYEIPLIDNSLIVTPYIRSIYILKQITNVNDKSEEETVYEKKKFLQNVKKLRIEIDFTSSFISFPEDVFEHLINVSFGKYFHKKKICQKNFDKNITYFICDNKILNTYLDKLVIIFEEGTKFKINLDDLFLPINKDKLFFGIISRKNISRIYIGEVFLKNYITYLNNERNSIRFYNKDILKVEKKEKYGLIFLFIIALLILILIYYMIYITCERDISEEKKRDPKINQFLLKDYIKKKKREKSKRNKQLYYFKWKEKY